MNVCIKSGMTFQVYVSILDGESDDEYCVPVQQALSGPLDYGNFGQEHSENHMLQALP